MTRDEWRRICQASGLYFSFPPSRAEKEMMSHFEVVPTKKNDPRPAAPGNHPKGKSHARQDQ